MRYGTIAIIGRSNVGKSTFLNSALGMPLAIVSSIPQTTRDTLLGVVNSGDAQLAFIDTPGLHHPKNELGRRMNQDASESLRSADAAVFMTDAHKLESGETDDEEKPATRGRPRSRATSSDRSDAELIALLPPNLPTVLVINKIDRLRDKTRLLPLLQGMTALYPFAAVVPISAKQSDGVDRVLAEVAKLLPEQDQRFPAD
ncbi:MAG: hypothetical protein RL033_2957, partial [Pseudomonadota bacterium]